jgi:uncharacterized RDD family membrane protein YckC
MEFTEEAKAAIEGFISKVLGRMSVSGPDRTEVEKELRSGYYESAEARASERGDTKVTLADVTRAIAAEGTPEQIAICYMKSYAGHLRRAGLLSRTVAYFLDAVIVSSVISILIVPWILLLVAAQDIDQSSWIIALVILINLAFVLTAVGVAMSYIVILEGYFGRTPGKYVMGLTVLKENGTKIGYREAFLRNIPKFFGNFIVIDALVMLLFFREEKQRGFDKVAGTIVVHTR